MLINSAIPKCKCFEQFNKISKPVSAMYSSKRTPRFQEHLEIFNYIFTFACMLYYSLPRDPASRKISMRDPSININIKT